MLGRAEVVEGARSGPRVQIRQAAAIDVFLIQSEQLAGPRICALHQVVDLDWMPKAHVLLVNFPLEQVSQVERSQPPLGLFLLLFVNTRLLILLLQVVGPQAEHEAVIVLPLALAHDLLKEQAQSELLLVRCAARFGGL